MKPDPAAWLKAENLRRAALADFASSQDEAAAFEALRKAASKAPTSAAILTDLVQFALRTSEGDIARQAARQLLKLQPPHTAHAHTAAEALTLLGNALEARQAWIRLLDTPHRPESLAALARLAERNNNLPEANDWLDQALAAAPRDAGTQLIAARIAARRGETDKALGFLLPLTNPAVPADFRHRALYQLGSLHDRADNAPTAAKAWKDAKLCLEESYVREIAACRAQHALLRARRQRLRQAITPALVAEWRARRAEPAPAPLTVLIGHPRSGTTLLEQVLAAHPRVVDLDEQNALPTALQAGIFRHAAGRDEVAALQIATPAQLSATRRDYRRRISTLHPLDSRSVILDKNPSLTDSAVFFPAVFPEIRYLTARRDPRDIALSCYQQSVLPDFSNIAWLRPDTLAADCQEMLEGWEHLRDCLGPDGGWMEVSYESLCTDFAPNARAATAFMGLEWDPLQENYQAARPGHRVASPTYADVRAPVHTRSIGRWERYADLIPELFTPWL
ncbi:MAG: hypothetical protein JWL81_81 [Verrucomicrobiales bacterium]|nr:hypothetical protein [Verrucomicrobiales bacterium]